MHVAETRFNLISVVSYIKKKKWTVFLGYLSLDWAIKIINGSEQGS